MSTHVRSSIYTFHFASLHVTPVAKDKYCISVRKVMCYAYERNFRGPKLTYTGNVIERYIYTVVQQNLGEFYEDLKLDFKLFFFVDSGSSYLVLEKSQ